MTAAMFCFNAVAVCSIAKAGHPGTAVTLAPVVVFIAIMDAVHTVKFRGGSQHGR
ncbi:hypothetical protein [Bradyrhizobium liaoningense]|uniref:hypothetical protein n=1 Tax=Bradyrhizobium liaoningense TaxID=43992 RepID=UPI001BA47266|nr:hypothetical protein [Bradyrhizobium liaoningense]MBR0712712.1 hypothetical protein [Bradyrhizobium liaoningense]